MKSELDTVKRFFLLAEKLYREGCIDLEVRDMITHTAATVSLAVEFPGFLWTGKTFLGYVAAPESFEAM